MDSLDVALGFMLGLASSTLFWWWTNSVLRPRIRWSPAISKVEDPTVPGGVKYRVKVMNSGRRPAVDFQAVCLMRVPGAGTRGNYKIIPLRTLDTPLPYLAPGRARTLSLKTFGIDPNALMLVPEPLSSLLNASPPVPLEEALNVVPGTHIELHLSAYDAISGTRGFFRTERPYVVSDITPLPFLPGSVEVGTETDEGAGAGDQSRFQALKAWLGLGRRRPHDQSLT